MACHAKVRTDSCYEELQTTMDDNEGTRIMVMIRDVGPGV